MLRPPRLRSGYTLIEMLVVLLIILVLLGMGVGGLYASRINNRQRAAEFFISDMIRSGKATAISSGAPVVFRIGSGAAWVIGDTYAKGDKVSVGGTTYTCSAGHQADAAKQPGVGAAATAFWQVSQVAVAEVMGTYRLPLYANTFDGADAGQGQSGDGWVLSTTGSAPASYPLSKGELLVRRAGDGFYLQASIRPPLATRNLKGKLLPVLMVGTNNNRSTAIAGLELECYEITSRTVPTSYAAGDIVINQPAAMQGSDLVSTQYSWRVHGWANGIDLNTNLGQTKLRSSPETYNDELSPQNGGKWMQLGLLYDGANAILLRDGRELDKTAVGSIGPQGVVEVFMGENENGPGMGILDNVNVWRLASDALKEKLPAGVVPASSYRIVIQAGGTAANGSTGMQVQIFDANQNVINDMTFLDSSDKKKGCVINVAADGSLRTKLNADDTPGP